MDKIQSHVLVVGMGLTWPSAQHQWEGEMREGWATLRFYSSSLAIWLGYICLTSDQFFQKNELFKVNFQVSFPG